VYLEVIHSCCGPCHYEIKNTVTKMSWEKCHGMLSFFASQFQNRHNSHKIVLDGPQNAPQGIGDCADKLLYTYRAIVLPVMGAYTFYK